MSAPGDFSGMGFAPGVVRGRRSFDVDQYGRLCGVTYPQVWTPGENTAKCRAGERGGVLWLTATGYMTASGLVVTTGDTTEPPTPPPPHNAATCNCGFYAYFTGADTQFHHPSRVAAVIEGYGETIIGTKGFRSQKARIVALCIPAKDERTRRAPLVNWLARHNRSTAPLAGAAAGTSIGTFIGAAGAFMNERHILAAVLALATLALAYTVWASFRSIDVALDARYGRAASIAPDLAEKVRRNYAGIPVFTDETKMLAAFPPDPATEPTPETDADFWTRSVP